MSEDKPKTPVLPSESNPRVIAEEPDPQNSSDKTPRNEDRTSGGNSETDKEEEPPQVRTREELASHLASV